MQMNRTSLTRTAATLGVAAVTAVGFAGPANAKRPDDEAGAPQKVHKVGIVNVNAGWTLGVRGTPQEDAAQYRQLADGAKALITCQTRGSKVSGTYGTSRIWDHLKNGGFVPDVYVYTGSDGRVAPAC